MEKFETMSESFDYCREVGHPVVVMVEDKKWKLYPSGKATAIKATRNIIDELNEKMARDRASFRALARMCGATVSSMDKDMRQPDPDVADDETPDPWDVNGERVQTIIWNELHPHPRAGRTENP